MKVDVVHIRVIMDMHKLKGTFSSSDMFSIISL